MKGELELNNPAHQQIADILREEIRTSRQAGQRLESSRSLARRFDVSHITVHSALQQLAREGLVESRRGSGTYICDRSDDRHIAVYIEKDISDPRCSYYYRRCVQQLRVFFQQRDVPARLYVGSAPFVPRDQEPAWPTCTEFLDAVKADQIRGVIAIVTQPHPVWIKPLQKRNVPIIGGVLDYEFGVMPDFQGMISKAVDHLISCERKNIALLCWNDPADRFQRFPDTSQLFKKEIERRGLWLNSDWICRNLNPLDFNTSHNGLRKIWTANGRNPDGLIVTDDFLYLSASQAIYELGINVPEQLSIVTVANKGSAMPLPVPAALLQIDPDQAVERLGNALLKLLEGRPIDISQEKLSFEWIDHVVYSSSLVPNNLS